MSIIAKLCYEHDLEKGVTRTLLPQSLLTGDVNAHEFVITLKRGGADADLSGATVSGYFVRQDGVTVLNAGTIDGNKAKVKLIANCYQDAGRYNLYIKLTKGEDTATIFWGTGSANLSSTDTVVVDENIIPSVEELLQRLEQGVSDAQIAAAVNKYLEENPVHIATDESLVWDDELQVLKVNTTDVLEAGNMNPVTSNAVATQVGNIEALLSTI